MGRPKLNIDPKKVEALASYGYTNKEIAAYFECAVSAISENFRRNIAKRETIFENSAQKEAV